MFNEENYVAKISNFGLSKLLGDLETHVSTRVMGSNAYMDPSYFMSGRLTKASDVYSFGIVLLVVLSGMPASDSSRQEKHRYVKDRFKKCSKKGNFHELIDPKLVVGIPSPSLGKFLHLIKRCVHENPKRRPIMAQVVVNLEESLDLLGIIDNGKEEREAQSTVSEQALQLPDTSSETAEQITRRAEIARLRELHTHKGHFESVMEMKGLDIDTMQQNYTV